jgi:hopanoid-associated phosphorylase
VSADPKQTPYVLAVTGLAAEARIAAGPGVVAISGYGDALAQLIREAIDEGAVAVISFGIAGALDPSLEPGACIVARTVAGERLRWNTDAAWSYAIQRAIDGAIRGDIAGADEVMLHAEMKAMLGAARGALAVDMESHVVARVASERGVPFAVLRVVSDPARRSLPQVAADAMRGDGGVDLARVMKSLFRNPGEIPLLARAGLDAARALRALRRYRALLGAGLAFPDFGELRVDVA